MDSLNEAILRYSKVLKQVLCTLIKSLFFSAKVSKPFILTQNN